MSGPASGSAPFDINLVGGGSSYPLHGINLVRIWSPYFLLTRRLHFPPFCILDLAVPYLTSTWWEVGPLLSPVFATIQVSLLAGILPHSRASRSVDLWKSALWPNISILPNLTSSHWVCLTPIPNSYSPHHY